MLEVGIDEECGQRLTVCGITFLVDRRLLASQSDAEVGGHPARSGLLDETVDPLHVEFAIDDRHEVAQLPGEATLLRRVLQWHGPQFQNARLPGIQRREESGRV